MYIHTCTIELWRSTRPSRVSAYVSGGKSQRRLRHTHTPQCVTFVRVCLPFRALFIPPISPPPLLLK